MRIERDGVTLELVTGDIAQQADIEAVVNAANPQLAPGGGVAGALHDAAGAGLWREARPLAPIRPGEAVTTGAYKLPNRYVIHALGPVYGRDEPSDELLAAAYRNALARAEEKQATSVAFPALSTGIYGYPVEAAAAVALRTVLDALPGLRHVRLVRFVLFRESDRAVHAQALDATLGA